ncbi:MAG: hypothetical protein ACQER7_06245 [Bacteroidota bacterium]
MKVPLSIKVHKVLYEYYVNIHGSERIEVKPGDNFSPRVKWMLQLYSESSKKYPLKHSKELILLLPNEFRLTGRNGKRVYTEHRGYLDEAWQYYLSKDLYKQFKGIFHASVLSFCIAKDFSLGCQKEAIYNFIDLYNLTLDDINFEMLKKSWDRSEEKKKMKQLENQKNKHKTTRHSVP